MSSRPLQFILKTEYNKDGIHLKKRESMIKIKSLYEKIFLESLMRHKKYSAFGRYLALDSVGD